MKVKCTHKSCNKELNFEERTFLGGALVNCGVCHRNFTIPLYCPTCDPPIKETKTWLRRPEGFIGGQLLTCPKGHSFRVPLYGPEIHDRLASMGTELSRYHQSAHIDALVEGSRKTAVSGGYCAGVALDWIRRALLGGKASFKDVEGRLEMMTFSGPMPEEDGDIYRARIQDERAAEAWVKQSKPATEKILGKQQSILERKAVEHRAAMTAGLDSAFEKYKAVLAKIDSGKFDAMKKDLLRKQAREVYLRADASHRSKHDKEIKKMNTVIGMPEMQRIWGDYSKLMDEWVKAERLAEGKVGGSKRPFSNLKIVRAQELKTWTSGVSELIDALLSDPAFRANRAAYLGVNPPSGGSGHAIAIHRLNTGGRYHVFDPNYGVYELTAPKLREVVLYLFRTVYPYSGGPGSDHHAFEVAGQVKGRYTIFEGKIAPAPSVAFARLPAPAAGATHLRS